jgi:hypothetical protein
MSGEPFRLGRQLDPYPLERYERVGCLARAEPPVTRPLRLDEMVTGLSGFDFQ